MKKLLPLFTAAAMVLTACSTGTNSGTETIKIGVIAPMTGDAAVYGQEMQRVLDWELPSLNAEFADSGYEFELVYEDGQCGSAAASAFQKLTDVDGVQYVLGGTCSSESLAIAPLLEDKGVVAVSALSSSPELDGISPNFVSLSYSDSGVAEEVAAQLSKYKKVAILTEQNDYNMAFYDTVSASLGASSELVADETVAKGSTDFRNALQKIKAANPEVVFFNVNVGVTAETMVKQLAELEGWDVAKVGTFSMMDDDYIALAPEMMEGFIVVDTPKIDSPVFQTTSDQITAAQGTTDNIGAYYTASTLDALMVIVNAVVAGENDPAAVLDEIRTGSFEGYIGDIRFGDETFVQGIGTAVYTVKDGVWGKL